MWPEHKCRWFVLQLEFYGSWKLIRAAPHPCGLHALEKVFTETSAWLEERLWLWLGLRQTTQHQRSYTLPASICLRTSYFAQCWWLAFSSCLWQGIVDNSAPGRALRYLFSQTSDLWPASTSCGALTLWPFVAKIMAVHCCNCWVFMIMFSECRHF